MMIIGVDYNPSFQHIAFWDQETGECGERPLNHSEGESERFYRELKQRRVSVRVGNRAWREVKRRPLDGASRSLEREFEEIIMVEVMIEEMSRSDGSRSKDYKRAVAVEAQVKEEQGRPLFGVNGV